MRLRVCTHARERFWQRVKPGLSDGRVLLEALSAYRSADPRFIWRAKVWDNPHRPATVVLVTVLDDRHAMPPAQTWVRFHRDNKWCQES